jgi:hypothetical protein
MGDAAEVGKLGLKGLIGGIEYPLLMLCHCRTFILRVADGAMATEHHFVAVEAGRYLGSLKVAARTSVMESMGAV